MAVIHLDLFAKKTGKDDIRHSNHCWNINRDNVVGEGCTASSMIIVLNKPFKDCQHTSLTITHALWERETVMQRLPHNKLSDPEMLPRNGIEDSLKVMN